MEKVKFTAIQNQVIKTIQKSVEKDLSEIKLKKERILKKISKLEDEIADLRGSLNADEELAQRDIENSMKALESYTGGLKWELGEKGWSYTAEIEDAVVEKPSSKNTNADCEVVEPIKPKVTEKKADNPPNMFKEEEEAEAQRKRDQEVADLPWEVEDEDEMPFKNIFNKK